MGNDFNRCFQRKSQIFKLAPASGAAYVVDAANLAASSRGGRTGFRSEIPKEMKMPNTPGTPSVTTNVPSQPSPEPVAATDTSPKIAITNTDKRQIDNLRLSVTFLINGQPHYDYEDHGTFNQVCVDRVYAYGGNWNGSQCGDFLHTESSQSTQAFLQTLNKAEAQTGYDPSDNTVLPNITIVNEEPRAITGLRVTADFTINGQPHYDYEDIGTFDRHYILELNAMNGTWNGS